MVGIGAAAGQRTLFVEGGGDRNQSLKAECREAFTRLQQGANVSARARVIACGSRKAAYDAFVAALNKSGPNDRLILLVDAEDVVTATSRWQHVNDRIGDGWAQPPGATEDSLHFMAVTMETWLLAEPSGLTKRLGSHFEPGKIPKWPEFEAVSKDTINTALAKATASQPYTKGEHSFQALKHVNATLLEQRCPSAAALFAVLRS